MDYATGIDVSVWQDDNSTAQKMNFAKAKAAGANFVFIKASERGGVDPDFIYNWQAAKEAGLPRGAYHFLRWDLSGLMQARIFCATFKDDPGELPPVADFEAPVKDGKYPSNALLGQFLEEVESITGVVPIIYTSPGFWRSYGKIKDTSKFDSKWAYYPLWIAHYMKSYTPGVSKPDEIEPWKSTGKSWTFWQYTSSGDGYKFGAESKGLDMNFFNGDMVDFHKFIGGEVVEPEEPEDPPVITPPSSDIEFRLANLEGWAKGIGYKG